MSAAENLDERESRARARRAEAAVIDERVLQVAEIMSRGDYTKAHRAALAAEWGGAAGPLAISTVENYTAEAARLSRLLARPQARLRLARALDAGMSLVERDLRLAEEGAGRCFECGRSDLDAAGKLPALGEKYAALTGANEVTKHEVALGLSPELEGTLGRLKQLPEDRRAGALEAFAEVVSCAEAGEVRAATLAELLAEARGAAEREGNGAVVAILDEAMAMTEQASVEQEE